MILTIKSYPQGPRCWIMGQRVHHGATGCLLLALARKHPRLALVGAALVAHDRHDWRVWFKREGVPAGLTVTLLTGQDADLDPASYPV